MNNDGQDNQVSQGLGALALASLLCCGMVGARAAYTGRLTFGFFCWNLLLAWVPLGLSLALARRNAPGRQAGHLGNWTLGAVWLVFFPNAPYIVTDLVHLRARNPVPLWFDALLVFGFALTGLCLAFVSLLMVHRLVERRRGVRAGWVFVGLVAALTGFGVYLGRFRRWNSWDLVTRPAELLADAVGWMADPFSHVRRVGVTVVFGAFFAITYLVLFALTRLRTATPAADRV